MSEKHIGFPPSLLTESPQRLVVLFENDDLIALEKPCDTLVEAHPWHPDSGSIVTGLQAQLKQKKPELEAYNIEKPFTIFHSDFEISGIALIAKSKAACAKYRNLYGSSSITLLFHFLATSNNNENESVTCDLPLAVFTGQNHMIVSHKTGKQCSTKFDCIQRQGKYQLWQASTTYHRMHQVRLHAKESGLNIFGDEIYNPAPKMSNFYASRKRIQAKQDKLIKYEHTHLHLANILIKTDEKEENINISAPLPKKFTTLLNQIKQQEEDKKAASDSSDNS